MNQNDKFDLNKIGKTETIISDIDNEYSLKIVQQYICNYYGVVPIAISIEKIRKKKS